MAMSMIHETIYETMHLTDEEVMGLTGAGDINTVIARRAAMREFLKYNKWDLEAYKAWRRDGMWTPKMVSRGLGDVIAKVTNAVGLKSCGGCKSRQKQLNKVLSG
jgi:hypothetical protein